MQHVVSINVIFQLHRMNNDQNMANPKSKKNYLVNNLDGKEHINLNITRII